MLKIFLLGLILGLWWGTASAQQIDESAKAATYRLLLSEANERLAATTAAVEALKAELAKKQAACIPEKAPSK